MTDTATIRERPAFDGVPFDIINRAIAAGKVIPFLGAGASMERRQPNDAWSLASREDFGPLGSELARWLATQSTFPNAESATDLARVAQFADSKIGRELLRDTLEVVFNPSPEPSDLHHYLASFEQPLLIITTNYDNTLEAAFDEANRPYHLVVQTIGADREASMRLKRAGSDTVDRVNSIEVDMDAATVIYKIHGSCGPGDVEDYLITEDDYLRFLQRMVTGAAIPIRLAEPMRTRQFLFIGYGLADWNLRLLLHQLKDYVSKPAAIRMPPSWAIMHSVDDVDRRLWADRSVELLEVPLHDFVSGMIAARDRQSPA